MGASTNSLLIIPRYGWNSCGTLASASLVVTADTYLIVRVFRSCATFSSQVSENSSCSYRVQVSWQPGVLNCISSDSQVPCSGCFDIHQKGRKVSISGSIGVTSKVSFEKCRLRWRSSGFVKNTPASSTDCPMKFSMRSAGSCLFMGSCSFRAVLMLTRGTEHPVSSSIWTQCFCCPTWISMVMTGRGPHCGYFGSVSSRGSWCFLFRVVRQAMYEVLGPSLVP